MQAIITKYLPATNHRGSWIKATSFSGSITKPYEYEYSTSDNHRIAANTLMMKFGWEKTSKIIGNGGLPSGDGEAFIMGDK